MHAMQHHELGLQDACKAVDTNTGAFGVCSLWPFTFPYGLASIDKAGVKRRLVS